MADYYFSNYKVNFLLEKLPIAICANPGTLIIGNFKQSQLTDFIKFDVFDVYQLFLCIIRGIQFFTDDKINSTEKEIIIQQNNSIIFWSGTTVFENGENVKIMSIKEEKNGNITFHFFFNIQQSQNLLIILKKAITATICFQSEDYIFINFILQKSENDLLKCVNFQDALKCVEEFNNLTTNKNINKIDFLQYYLEILFVLRKLTTLIFDENPRRKNLVKLSQV